MRLYPIGLLACVAFQHFLRLTDVFEIVFPRLLPYAATVAVVDMIFEARTVFTIVDALLRDRLAAPSWLERLMDELQHIIHSRDVRVRSKIGSKLLVDVPGLEDTWEILVGHDDRRVCLAVL